MKRIESLHTFTMGAAFAHEDEGTAVAAPRNVKCVMSSAKEMFPGVVTLHNLSRSVDKVLSSREVDNESMLLATSFCGDEVNRDFEDEFRSKYGANFHLGGIAGFPFGGVTAFGAMMHHIAPNGSCIVIYGPHVGIDLDGVVGKVNRKGHEGSGACCNTAMASMAYVKAVRSGHTIHSPDPSDPLDAQQVFVDSALLAHAERLERAENPAVELPYALFDCQDELLGRIIAKCTEDIPTNTRIILLGGIIVNTPSGTPEYFLPRKFQILDSKGVLVEDILGELKEEGNKDPKALLMERKRLAAQKKVEAAKAERVKAEADRAKAGEIVIDMAATL
mmetsp:Transcript_38525/g.56537  ORF Transcript_38525/g.56537 Transcript_38525/m.56537 type:complete len:334 (-) Transcript_38525:429-1430(-)